MRDAVRVFVCDPCGNWTLIPTEPQTVWWWWWSKNLLASEWEYRLISYASSYLFTILTPIPSPFPTPIPTPIYTLPSFQDQLSNGGVPASIGVDADSLPLWGPEPERQRLPRLQQTAQGTRSAGQNLPAPIWLPTVMRNTFSVVWLTVQLLFVCLLCCMTFKMSVFQELIVLIAVYWGFRMLGCFVCVCSFVC